MEKNAAQKVRMLEKRIKFMEKELISVKIEAEGNNKILMASIIVGMFLSGIFILIGQIGVAFFVDMACMIFFFLFVFTNLAKIIVGLVIKQKKEDDENDEEEEEEKE